MIPVLAQAVGIIASVMNIISFQMKDNRRLYVCQSIGGALFALNFFLLGSYTGALLNLFNLFRGAVLAAGKKWCKWYTFILIQALYIFSCVITYSGYISVVVTVAQLIGTVILWTRNGKVIRVVQFFTVSPAWLFHNIVCFSLGGIITEVISMGSIIVSFIRFGWKGFEKE